MFFANAVRSKLASLLRPWLEEEPEPELKLGFLNSHYILKNLTFDSSLLSSLIKNSTNLEFSGVKIEKLSFRISPWSVPSLIVKIRGVQVTLARRESLDQRRVVRGDSDARRRKAVISLLDPVGSYLHDIIERISSRAASEKGFLAVLTNVVLRCCQIEIEDVYIKLQFTNDSPACLLTMDGFSLESQLLHRTSLVKGFFGSFGSLFLSRKLNFVDISCSQVDFGLKENDHTNWMTSMMGLSVCVSLDNLLPFDYSIQIPHMGFKLTPTVIPVLLVLLDVLSPKRTEDVRNGQELWKIAARKIGYTSLIHKFSLYRIVKIVLLWSRYVREYESLILMVGHSASSPSRNNKAKVFSDNNLSTHVKRQWKLVSELEDKLPAEALASARRIARYRTLSCSGSGNLEPAACSVSPPLLKILALISYPWRVVCFIFQSIVHLSIMWNYLYLREGITTSRSPMFGGISNDPASQFQFNLGLGELCITLSQENVDHSVMSGKIDSGAKHSYLKSASFCFFANHLSVIYTAYVTTNSLLFAFGEFKLQFTSSSSGVSTIKSHSRDRRNLSSNSLKLKTADESKAILWSDPALLYNPSGNDAFSSSDVGFDNAMIFTMENSIRDLCSSWEKVRRKYGEMNVKHKEQPFLLCELKNFLIDTCIGSGDYGLCKCSLALGKLNFDLDSGSISSITLLLSQMHFYYQWSTGIGRRQTSSNSGSVMVQKIQTERTDYVELYTTRVKAAVLKILPDKNIQIGAFITGPSIRLSLQNGFLGANERDMGPNIAQGSVYCFSVDLASVEVGAWPASTVDLAQTTEKSNFNEGSLKYLRTMRSKKDVPEPHTNRSFVSQGCIQLDVCMRFYGLEVMVEDPEVNHQSQIVKPMSIILQSSTCRDYFHSLTATVNHLSMAMSGITTSATILLYTDELWILLQIFEDMFSVASSACSSFDSVSGGYSQDFIKMLMASAGEVTERNIVDAELTNETKIVTSTQILLDSTLQFESVDIILNDSRVKCRMGTSVAHDGASSSGTPYFSMSPDGKKLMNPEVLDLPSFSIGVSIQKLCTKVSWEGTHLSLLSDFSRFESVVFSHQNFSGACTDISQIKSMPGQPSEGLYMFIISTWKLSIHSDPHGVTLLSAHVRNTLNGFVSSQSSDSTTKAKGTDPQSSVPDHNLKIGDLLTSTTPAEALGCYLLVDMQVGEISMAAYGMNRQIIEGHQSDKLEILVMISKDTHKVNCEIQGGYIFLETSSLAAFVHCFQAYSLLIRNSPLKLSHASRGSSKLAGFSRVPEEIIAKPTNFSTEEFVVGALSTTSVSKAEDVFNCDFFKDFTVNLSRFSLTFAGTDVSGQVDKLILEVDTSLRLLWSERMLLFDLKRLSLFTQNLHKYMSVQPKDMLMPHLCSSSLVTLSSERTSGNFKENIPSGDGEHFMKHTTFPKEELVENYASSSICGSDYILKHVVASIMLEKLNRGSEVRFLQLKSDWVGNGSISGIDLMVTFSQVQFLSALFAPLSGIFSRENSRSVRRSIGSRTQEWTNESNQSIPDGAVVVIKDLHEHMYFAVEDVNNKYHLVGTLHYTLVGERALFRVKYHKRWMSKVSCISLISLYAKNDKGEPLRLNYSRESGFVEISSSNDKGGSLWQMSSYKPNSYEDDDDAKSYSRFARKAFHLVNQKSDCAIAFVDGLPEFVKKPGNLFKAKVLNEFSFSSNGRLSVPNGHSNVTSDTNSQGELSPMGEVSGFVSTPSYVNITIDMAVLTISHDISDENDKAPLIRGSITDISIIGQILFSKCRLISSFNVGIQYMELQRNLWRDIISPVGSSLFFHSRFSHEDLSEVIEGVPAHVYFSMRQVDISVTETTLDVLLYVVGYLNIAGPYAVRRSLIFPNCCKIENHTGLSLLCHFPNNQNATIAGKQSASIFLRHVPVTETESLVTVCLAEHGFFSTSPIHLSFTSDCLFAWRTRAISVKDSRSFPGPFVVVEVRQRTEDGLSLVVSPLLRICNESGFSMELRFNRPQETEGKSATVLLKTGDIIDDSVAVFNALKLSGDSKRALMSLTLGNFLLSVRPDITENNTKAGDSVSIKWSEELQGGKAIRLSGIFDKLSYRFKKAFGVESITSSLSSLCCPLFVEDQHISDIYFLVQTTGRDVPIMRPPNVGTASGSSTSPVALQVQKEIFILPTVLVYNLLQSEIHVLLTETDSVADLCVSEDLNNYGKSTTISSGSNAYLYANPAMIYFTVTLTAYSSKCKPVSSIELLKKLDKQKSEVHYIDTELTFGGGKYVASLRLSRADKGILEVTIFSSYTLQNDTELPLVCSASNQKPLTWQDLEKYGSNLSPELGCFLPPKSTGSWLLKSNKVHLKWLEEKTSSALLDLDLLSGFTELRLEAPDNAGFNCQIVLGVSLQPCPYNVSLPSQVICIVPRYIIANDSKEPVIARQCYLQDDTGGISNIEGNQKIAPKIRNKSSKKREASILDSIIRRHRNVSEDSQVFLQFRLKEIGCSWSGPICVSSLGRFFLKFKISSAGTDDRSNLASWEEKKSTQFAVVQIVEENSSLVLHFYKPVNVALPYRVENYLRGSSIKYWQKDTEESDTLMSGDTMEYVWDDLNLPHKLVVEIVDLHLSREINIDKICTWKSFFKMRQHKRLVLHLPSEKGTRIEKRTDESHGLEVFKVGYEVYADGLTRVLRLCERVDSFEEEKTIQPSFNFHYRISYFALNLLENKKQETESDEPACSTIIVARLADIALDSLITERYRYHSISIQSINVDEKWQGAPFASMLRRNQTHDVGSDENILHLTFIVHSTDSSVKQVKYSSIILQPIDLKIDEETLMKLVPFWRTSLSDSTTRSQQFYFKHFEIHPIKIFASFLPGNPNFSYSSAQETLRSLLHSVIKVPAVNNTVVELNGILLTHALVTFRELLIKSAQHYSWYVIRAVYKAKGSSLLPPAFASIFDDTASSSLDVFFDPSDGSVSLPGLTLGMFKFISKCIDSKGFSGTKRYFGDLGKSIKRAGSSALFAAVTEISDSILKGAETNGLNGLVTGFHQGIMTLAMEPSLLGAAVFEGGPDRKIKLDQSPGVDELYIEGYLQAMLDVVYKQEFLRVRVVDNQVVLKNLPPNSSVINEIMDNVKSFLVSKALLKGDMSTASRPLRHLRTENEWRIGPTVLTLCEHLFVSFAIRMLRKQANRIPIRIRWGRKAESGDTGEVSDEGRQENPSRKWGVTKFVFSGLIAYLDGRLCRHIPNPIARRIVSGFLLSYLDQNGS